MEIKLSDRQLYLLIRIFHVISLEICLSKILTQRLMVSQSLLEITVMSGKDIFCNLRFSSSCLDLILVFMFNAASYLNIEWNRSTSRYMLDLSDREDDYLDFELLRMIFGTSLEEAWIGNVGEQQD
uniref:Uncharacterized protein n=1 Tax=Oryza sativa subsp. japonica TaxID=39947 RepID=Q339F0_ORYSJ|nr:hypothetical protein LOC_Os10g21710 [Oryza sativa Japonica Group]